MSLDRKAYYLLIGFFCFFVHSISGQDQKLSDSLINLYDSGYFRGNELELLKSIAEEESNPEKSLKFSELLIKKASSDSLYDFLFSGNLQKGYALYDKGSYSLALESFFKSLNYAIRIGNELGISGSTISGTTSVSATLLLTNSISPISPFPSNYMQR